MMIDKDKVIKGLECCNVGTMCDECDYHISQFCLHELKADALALLKEQEPIEPIIKQEMDDVCSCIDAVAYCGKCGAYIGRLKQNYCHECGQAVKWE